MKIQRDTYLQQLIDGRENGMIKIVTGLRRSGKSFLLFTLFHDYLLAHGVDEAHLIEIALDDRRQIALRDPDKMIAYIDERCIDNGRYTILLDEVQMMDDFVDVLNSLLHLSNVDIYVTGSNSRFLSHDIATEFRGRGDEIHLYPLSFAEFYAGVGGDKTSCWKQYYTFGGLPQVLSLSGDRKKEDFLENLQASVYIKDMLERNKLRNESEFQELLKVMASGIGSPCNPHKLVRTFKSEKNVAVSNKTLTNYLSYMEDAFMIERAERYDIKGKRYINALSKYYFQDVGLRNALLSFRQLEESHLMENIIYNDLRRRGCRVDVGAVEVRHLNQENQRVRKRLEVDFVANQGDNRYYIQSALALPDAEKKRQEAASLLAIKDSFLRVIIVKDDIQPYRDENGILILGLFDFLLSPELFNL